MIEQRPLSVLIPFARNSRTHSDAQIDQLAASMREWGFTNPILVDEHNTILAGHGRLSAARKLGLDHVPVIVARGWTDAQKRAYVIADNKLAINAGWDQELLILELKDLAAAGFDMPTVGYDADELGGLLGNLQGGPLTDPDDAPPVAPIVITAAGDLWLMGPHSLTCGDATVATDVQRALRNLSPHLMVTDPPYGVDYDPEWRERRGLNGPLAAKGRVSNDDRADWREAWALFPGEVAYVWCASLQNHKVAESLEASGYELRSLLIWVKHQFAIGRGHYHWQHEPCWYAVKAGGIGHWSGDRTQSTVWNIDKPQKSETGHSTQKPVECMKRPIDNNSKIGDAVYDPFMGSGTTLIAAESTGRVCLGLEINPTYVDVAVRRWQAYTGKAATLAGDGRAFAELETQRCGAAIGASYA